MKKQGRPARRNLKKLYGMFPPADDKQAGLIRVSKIDAQARLMDSPVLAGVERDQFIKCCTVWEDLDAFVDDHEAVTDPGATRAFTPEELAADRNAREPNFRDKDDKFQLVRCFWCHPEGRGNLAPSIPRAICNWCGARSK